MNDIRVFKTQEELYHQAAGVFLRTGSDAIRKRGKYAVALSGGSTPLPLYQVLAQSKGSNIQFWDKIHLFWGDERPVGPDHPDSNYLAAYQTLIAPANLPSGQIHRIQGELEPEIAAQRYQEEILDWFDEHPPRFDLILLGLGSDGHTASLFPGTIHDESDTWVDAYYVEKLNSYRISFTSRLINAAAQVIILVKGPDKADALNRVINGSFQPEILPAQLIQPTNGQLIWLVDSEAASELNS